MLPSEYGQLYRNTLINDVIPFWMKHAVGADDGAINNCLDDEGAITSTDRFLWSQGRALWTFSALYNRIDARQEWLDVARGIANYLYAHGRDEQKHWMYRLDASGNTIEGDVSIYVDGFMMNGLGEYYAASGDPTAARIAVETWEQVGLRLRSADGYLTAPYAIPDGLKVLGIRMLFSMVNCELGRITNRRDIQESGIALADELLADFYDPEKNMFREYVAIDGKHSEMPETGVCIPGHVIEAMWFIIRIFEQEPGREKDIAFCCNSIRGNLEIAWDIEYGGLLLAVDVDGRDTVKWPKADCKPWWVHVEALVATALAYIHCGEEWCLDWHEKVRQYVFSHYPIESEEWTQWLDRQGNKTGTAALPVKDPFHLPRALIYLIDIMEHRIPGRLGQ